VEKGNAIKGAIALVPVGPVSPDLLTWLDSRLVKVLGRDVIVGESIPLPEAGYDPRRRQYLGQAILAALRALPYPTAGRVLGLTEADCTTPGLNFIFGQAALNGREAFVALPAAAGSARTSPLPARSWHPPRPPSLPPGP
jgi:predicted Zn-dependent protease